MDRKNLKTVGYGLLTLFIVWHAVGISVVGPAAQSYMRDGLMKIYEPYLTLLNLDRSWPFYAPNPFLGSMLEYETVSATGKIEKYPLTKAYKKYEHAYFRYTNFYAYLFADPKYSKKRGYDKSVARYLCSRHSANVESINFILWQQKEYTYQDYRDGKEPLSQEFLNKKVYGPYPCNKST